MTSPLEAHGLNLICQSIQISILVDNPMALCELQMAYLGAGLDVERIETMKLWMPIEVLRALEAAVPGIVVEMQEINRSLVHGARSREIN